MHARYRFDNLQSTIFHFIGIKCGVKEKQRTHITVSRASQELVELAFLFCAFASLFVVDVAEKQVLFALV